MASPITVACPMPDCGWTASLQFDEDCPPNVIAILTGNADKAREHHISQHGALTWFAAWEKLAAGQAGPRRGDAVEAWLKAQRDEYGLASSHWGALDLALDDYQLHADTGTPLGQHCCEGGTSATAPAASTSSSTSHPSGRPSPSR